MLNVPERTERTLSLPRLLPQDEKLLAAVANCQREFELARSALEEFRDHWFREDPPRRGDAREAAMRLEGAAVRLRNSARDLLHLTDPTPP
jgi:hypothetical protein